MFKKQNRYPPPIKPKEVVLVTGCDVTTTKPDTGSLLKQQEESGPVVTETESTGVVSPLQLPSQPILVHQPDSSIPDSPSTIPETQIIGPVRDSQTDPVDEPDVASQISTPAKTYTDNIHCNTQEKKILLGSGRYFSMDPFRKMVPEVVEKLGRKFYMLDIDENKKVY